MTEAATIRTSGILSTPEVEEPLLLRLQGGQERWHVLLGLDEQVLQIQQDGLLDCLADEGGRMAFSIASTRSSDPVDVVLDVVGHVVVDHVFDLGEVESLRGHIRGDEDILGVILELLHSLRPLLLVFSSMD